MKSSLDLSFAGFSLANARALAQASAAAYRQHCGIGDAGVPPSSGAASSECLDVPQFLKTGLHPHVAAPEDGRTPLGSRVPPTPQCAVRSVAAGSPGIIAEIPATGPAPVEISAKATDTRVLLTEYDDCTVIAFRGTADLRNWITDAEFGFRRIPGAPVSDRLKPGEVSVPAGAGDACGASRLQAGAPMRVHRGFLTAVDSVIGEIVEELKRGSVKSVAAPNPSTLQPSNPSTVPPLVLTGHSLGGALAVLAAHILAAQGFNIHSVYTFGQPRVGDANFAARYNAALAGRVTPCAPPGTTTDDGGQGTARPTLGDRTFRIVNANDLVPRLPGWLMGYRHCGQNCFINLTGSLIFNPSLFTLLTTDLLGLYRAYRKLDDVLLEDHCLTRYLAALGRPDVL